MKHSLKRLMLAAALTTVIGTAAALDPVLSWNPRTGDAWVDVRLGDINQYANRYRAPFVDEMVRYYGAPRSLVDQLLNTRRWTPGDVYYACAIARTTGRACRDVVNAYDEDRGQGWGVIAKRMGIKPGSAHFHTLKRSFVRTYDRWGRPILLDAELRRDYPNRGGRNDRNEDRSDHGSSHKGKSADRGKTHGQAHKADHGKPASSGKGKGHDGNGKGNGGKGKGSNGKGGNGKGKG